MSGAERFALDFLLNAVWQVPLLAAGAAAAGLALRRSPAGAVHALWCGALVLTTLVPLSSALREDRHHTLRLVEPEAVVRPSWMDPVFGKARAVGVPATPHVPASVVASFRVARVVPGAYGIVLLALAVRLGRSWRRTRVLARTSWPAPPRVRSIAESCAEALGAGPVTVRLSASVSGPVTFGALDPLILLPARLAHTATPEELRSALAHEIAHVIRRDYLVRLVTELLALPVAWHPATLWIRKRAALSREMACDEAAIAVRSRPSYARDLLAIAGALCPSPRTALTLDAIGVDVLEERMTRLLRTEPMLSKRQARLALAVSTAALALIGLGSTRYAVAVAAEPAGGLAAFAGRWRGVVESGDLKGLPGADVIVTTGPEGEPRASMAFYMYRPGPDGAPQAIRSEAPPILRQTLSGSTLTLRVRVPESRSPKGSLRPGFDADWQMTLVGRDEARLRSTWDSRGKGADPDAELTVKLTRAHD